MDTRGSEKQSNRPLVVIDTDAGGDDAVAILAAVHEQSSWDVTAITTVHGNVGVDQITENVLRILNFVGRTGIPVYKGCHRAMLHEFSRDFAFHGEDGLSGNSKKYPLPDSCGPKTETAVHALTRLAKENQKKLTLVCLGPLTNVALAHRLDRHFGDNLKELLIMGGNLNGEGNVTANAEFNFVSDCEAADIVLHELACPKTVVAWEACQSFKKSWEWFDRWTSKDTPRARFVADVLARPVASCTARGYSGFYSCDLLAMTSFVHPDVVRQSIDQEARVELRGEHTRGMTIVERRPWRSTEASSSSPSSNVRFHIAFDEDAVTRLWDALTD